MGLVFGLPSAPVLSVYSVEATPAVLIADFTYEVGFTVRNAGVGTAENVYIKGFADGSTVFIDGDSVALGSIPANSNGSGSFALMTSSAALQPGSSSGWTNIQLDPRASGAVSLATLVSLDVCSCDCGFWGDTNNDGQINPLDVTVMVQYVYYQNDMRVQPPCCPLEAGDVAGCDGQVNPQDVTFYVQYVYYENDMFCPDPCGP